MSNVNAEIKMQGNDDAWFTANASVVFADNIQIFHNDGRYKFTDGVTALSALPFLGGNGASYTLTTSEIGSVINAATTATPNDTDLVISVDSSVAKKNTWTQIKSFLKTYFDTIYQAAGTYLTSANITQTITNGVTDKAPSEDVVFDALALKRSTTSEMLLMNCFATGITMADATTYYFGSLINSAPLTVPNWNKFTFPNNYTITKVILTVFQNAGGSNENVSLYLRYNNTTDYTITTTLNLTTPNNTSKTFTFTLGSPISVVSGGDYEFKIVTPTWATNPTLSRFFITLYGY